LDYCDNPIPLAGQCRPDCATEKNSGNFRFVVTTLQATPVLGLQTCLELGLIKRIYQLQKHLKVSKPEEQTTKAIPSQAQATGNMTKSVNKACPEQIIEQFSDVFEGIGRLKRTVQIRLKEGVTPHVGGPRQVPLALHDKVKAELQNMMDLGVIKKVDHPTEWVNNMVVVDSGEKLRICLDPRALNKAIKRAHYPIRTAGSIYKFLHCLTPRVPFGICH